LREKAKENPNQYVAMNRPEIGRMGGKDIVVNCPCNYLKKYEDFIWGHRGVIARYISKRAKQQAEAAYEDEAQAEFLKENVERMDDKIICEDEVSEGMDEDTKKEIARAMS
jgi:hypothetical protein